MDRTRGLAPPSIQRSMDELHSNGMKRNTTIMKDSPIDFTEFYPLELINKKIRGLGYTVSFMLIVKK